MVWIVFSGTVVWYSKKDAPFSALQHGSLVPQDFGTRKKRVPVVPARFLAVIYAPLFGESAVKCSVQR